MWHKPCRTFHPWCPCIKTRCLFPFWTHQPTLSTERNDSYLIFAHFFTSMIYVVTLNPSIQPWNHNTIATQKYKPRIFLSCDDTKWFHGWIDGGFTYRDAILHRFTKLTHCGPVTSYDVRKLSQPWLRPDGTKPLADPMLTNHWWGFVALCWCQFHRKCWRYISVI